MPTPPYPLRGNETFHLNNDGFTHRVSLAHTLDAFLVSRGLIPALSPANAWTTVDKAAGSAVVTVTGFLPGETIDSISPADGRLAINAARTGIIKGQSPSYHGDEDYTLATSIGRQLSIRVTTTKVAS